MKLSTLLAGGMLALGLSTTAFAADVVVEQAPVVEAPVVYDWSGFYVGVSGGYADPNLSISSLGNDIEYGESGYMIGGTIGYNFQYRGFVAGIEGDISYLDIDSSYTDLFGFGPNFGGDSEAGYYATIRARLGYAFDRLLVYGTAGGAFTDLETRTEVGDLDDDTQSGSVVGGGVEYGITQNFTAKLEYLHSDFGDNSEEFFPGPIDTDFDMDVVRIGFNYKF